MLEIEPTAPRRSAGARARVAVAVAAVALATGAGGFAIGRAAAPNSERAVGAITDSASDGPQTTDPPARTNSTDDASASEASEISATTMPSSAAPAADTAMPSGAMGGQYAQNAYAEQPLELLAERTNDDGVTIRVHINRYDAANSPYSGVARGDGWTPAGWCYPSGDLRISVSAPDSTNLTWGAWYSEPKDGLAVTSFATGYVEGHPRFGVVAQVGADVTTVTLTTTSGATDTTAPINGVALLIVTGDIDQNFTVDVVHADGQSSSTGAAALVQPWSGFEYSNACEPPPPALPDAGEQPADPAAAETAIVESWRIAHDYANSDADLRRSYVDDDTGLAEAWAALQNGDYAEAARTSVTTIRELVFTTPTEAWFRYDIDTSIVDFTNRYGIARLGDDGTWRITRQTICQDVALAPGFGCMPTVDTLYPPSAANDPRYNGAPVDGVPVDGISFEG